MFGARLTLTLLLVRLGNSGLKISKIILGCMSYGDPRWQEWVLPEEEAIKHIKYAYVKSYSAGCMRLDHPFCCRYDHGITTFDTANVSASYGAFVGFLTKRGVQIYSHGQSEIILGNAIKKLDLPRDELVILTKVRIYAPSEPIFQAYRAC